MKLPNASHLVKFFWAAILVQGVLAVWISRPWITADSVEYLKLANALSQGSYGSLTTEGFQPDVLRPPGYPLLLWLLHYALALPLWAISAVQVATLWISIFLVQRMLERFQIAPWPMLALAAAYPFPAMYSANLMTEAWAGLALTGVAAILVLGKRTLVKLFIVGLIGGGAVLLRADLLLLPPLVAVLITLDKCGGSPMTKRATGALVSLVGAALVVLPYMAWNYVHFGQAKPIPLAGALGNSLYIATWQPLLPSEDIDALYAGIVTIKAEAAGLGNEVRAMNQAMGAPSLTAPWNPVTYPTRDMQIRSTKLTLRLAIHRIRNDPQSYAQHVALNSWRLWNTGTYPASVPHAVVSVLSIVSGLIFIAGMAGVIMTIVGWVIPRWVAVLFLYVPSIHLFLHTEARYTAPARPLLLLFAGAFCWWAVGKVLARRSDPLQTI